MPLSVPIGCGYMVFRFRLLNDPEEAVVTCGFDATAGFAAGGNAMANDLSSAFLAAFPAAQLNTEFTFVGTTVRWKESAAGLSVYENLRNVTGTGVWAALPSNCAYLVRKTTARAGKRGKGRMYFPWINDAESQVDARGVITTATVASMQTKVNTLFTGIQAKVLPVLLHTYPEGGTPEGVTAITGFVVDGRIATRRLRMRP